MPVRRTTTRRTKTATRARAARRMKKRDAFSTALLLPGIHPWLKEYLAEENLVPLGDEVTRPLPAWEVIPFPTTSIATLLVLAAEQPELLAAARVRARIEAHERAPRTAKIPVAVRTTPPPPERAAQVEPTLARQEPRTPPSAVLSVPPLAPAAPAPSPVRSAARIVQAPPVQRAPIATPPPTRADLTAMHAAQDIPRACVPAEEPIAAAPLPPRTPQPLPPGARRTSAPVPFTIPIDARTVPAAPAHNLLRIVRRAPTLAPAAPNLLTTAEQPRTSTFPRATDFLSHVATHAPALPRARVHATAPWRPIPAPFNELLLVELTAPAIEVLWKRTCWPLAQRWAAFRAAFHRPALVHRTPQDRAARIAAPAPRRAPLRSFLPALQATLATRTLAHAGSFALVLLIVLFPLKVLGWGATVETTIRGRVLGASVAILEDFSAGGDAIATSSFASAVAAFDRAAMKLDALPQQAGPLPRLAYALGRALPGIGAPLDRAEDARRAGIALADAARAATRGVAILQSVRPDSPDAGTLFAAARASFATARTLADGARTRIASVAPSLAAPVSHGVGTLRRAEALVPIVEALAGIGKPRRILLLFQNPAELRPTGGFIGSVALLDVADGSVRTFEVPGGGSYDVSGLTRARVLPPEPLLLLNETWQFHDANWFPDFPTSARKLRWFYEESGGPTVDAIVAVNAPFLEDLLAITGDVTVSGTTFRAVDVLATLTNTIESSAARASSQPKAIIADVAPVILERILAMTTDGTASERLALLDRLLRALDERDVLLAFADDAVQRHVAVADWDGALRSASRDALAIYHTNIGGGKSDAAIRDDVLHETSVLADGRIIDRVTITRTHTATPVAKGAPPLERLTAMQNVDYVRVYVPRGAKLLAADGFTLPPAESFHAAPSDASPDRHLLATELDERISAETLVRTTEEFGRTAFGGWLLTPPGEQHAVTLTYELPWTYAHRAPGMFGRSSIADAQPYALLIQKQPGTAPTWTHRMSVDPAWGVAWHSENLTRAGDAYVFTDAGKTDAMTGMMLAPRNN